MRLIEGRNIVSSSGICKCMNEQTRRRHRASARLTSTVLEDVLLTVFNSSLQLKAIRPLKSTAPLTASPATRYLDTWFPTSYGRRGRTPLLPITLDVRHPLRSPIAEHQPGHVM